MTHFAEIPDLVLGPLAGRPEVDWYKAPPGKWCAAQIVHHLALALENSGRTFELRRGYARMQRRPRSRGQRLAYFLVMRFGWIPPVVEAPAAVRPADHPECAAVALQLKDGVARYLALEGELMPARRNDLFVKHPALGDLTFPEWLRFHVWHCAHHAKQIHARLGE